jgi:hypothetical protein
VGGRIASLGREILGARIDEARHVVDCLSIRFARRNAVVLRRALLRDLTLGTPLWSRLPPQVADLQDAAYVSERVAPLAQKGDLSRFIL